MRREINGLADLVHVKGGGIDRLFKAELARVLADLEDRAAVKSSRTLTLKIALQPRALPNGVLDCVGMEFEVTSKLPVTRIADVTMIPVSDKSGAAQALAFNDILSNEPRQMGLDEAVQNKPEQREEGA